MTDKQLKQVKAQLPEGQRFDRAYRALEGDIRVISRDKRGNEYRYTVRFDRDGNATIESM